METFVIKLAVAVVPLLTFIAAIVLTDSRSRKRMIVIRRTNRTRVGVRHAFAVAAKQKWL